MRRLLGFGQIIASDVPLPGARELIGGSDIAPGVSITRDASADGESEASAGFALDGGALRLTVPGVATYRCSASRILVAPRALATTADIGARLIAGALPASLWMQGRLVLHAAAVCLRAGEPALAILGRSGAGKSTLAAGLVEGGALLLADDSIALDLGPDHVIASGLPGGLFLRDGVAARRFQPVPRDRMVDAARLGALIILEDAADAGLARLAARRALEAALVHRHRPNAPALLGLRSETLRDCARLARSIPIYAWRRPNVMLARAFDEADLLRRALIEENFGS